MISESFNIEEFVEAVRGKDYLEVLGLADREALEAWRESRRRSGHGREEIDSYESALKELMMFMRSSVRRGKQEFARLVISHPCGNESFTGARAIHGRMDKCPVSNLRQP